MTAGILLAVIALAAAAAPNAVAAGGSISGTITGAPSHGPVPGAEVCATKVQSKGEFITNKQHCAFTAPDGHYEIGSLGEGFYVVVAWPRVQGQNYLAIAYDEDGVWPSEAVTVSTGALTGIDIELPEGGGISGRITEEVGGNPLAGVQVCASPGYEEREPVCTVTGADGKYLILGLSSQDYRLAFLPSYSGLQYFGERYEDQIIGEPIPGPAVPVAVTTGSVTNGIDAALEPSAEVRGLVTVAATGAPRSGTLVCIAPADSFLSDYGFADERKCTRTGPLGTYAIGGLEGGQYKVLFSLELRDLINYFPPIEPEEDGFPTRYWNEEDVLWNANVLTLYAPVVVTGINAQLGPFPPAPLASATPPATAIQPKKPKCKAGRRAKKVKGEYRCVRSHPRKHRGHKPPARGRSSSSLGLE